MLQRSRAGVCLPACSCKSITTMPLQVLVAEQTPLPFWAGLWKGLEGVCFLSSHPEPEPSPCVAVSLLSLLDTLCGAPWHRGTMRSLGFKFLLITPAALLLTSVLFISHRLLPHRTKGAAAQEQCRPMQSPGVPPPAAARKPDMMQAPNGYINRSMKDHLSDPYTWWVAGPEGCWCRCRATPRA